MSLKSFSEEIGRLISSDNLEVALKKLSHFFANSQALKNIILQSARLKDLKEKIILGVISFEDENITKNKIRLAILDILEELEEGSKADNKIEQLIEDTLSSLAKNQNITNSGFTSYGGKIIQKGKNIAGRDINFN